MTRTAIVHCAAAAALLFVAVSAGAQSAPRPPRREAPDSVVLLRPSPAAPPVATLLRGALRPAAEAPVIMPVLPMPAASPPPPAPVSATIVAVQPEPMPSVAPPPFATTMSAVASATVTPDQLPPAGATARCKDGTFLSGGAPDQGCAGKGGLSIVLTPPRQIPVRAARP